MLQHVMMCYAFNITCCFDNSCYDCIVEKDSREIINNGHLCYEY